VGREPGAEDLVQQHCRRLHGVEGRPERPSEGRDLRRRLAAAADVIAACGQVLEEECVAVPWRHGTHPPGTATSSSSTTGPSSTPGARSSLRAACLPRCVNDV
jgi:hypothetical protein